MRTVRSDLVKVLGAIATVGCAFLGLPACGGGGSGGGGTPDAAFVTADPRGMTQGGAVGDGLSAPSAPGAAAADAGGEVAREIAEADLVRTQGDLLFLANAHRGLVIVDLATMTVRGRLELGGFPHELLLVGARALVFVSDPATGLASLVDVAVGDPSTPSETARTALGGGYRAARLVGSIVVAVTDGAVASFALGASVVAVDEVTLPHAAAFVHATPTLFAITSWGDGLATPITLVDVSSPTGDLVLRGSVSAPGWIGDEQKLDLFGGVLRVVTHDGNDGARSRCLTYGVTNPDAPTLLGSLDLVRGEQLFATRFDGDRAYVVTFEQVDPLWVLDLSNPAAPTIAGQLVVPGWSTHLVPTGDGRLVAVGVDPTAGWHTIVSLFSVANPAAPALLDREDFGWGGSTAFHDVKALGVFPAEGLVTVPVSGETERLVVLSLGATSLSLRGDVALDGPAVRGFPHARGLVAVSNEEVALVDPLTLADRGRVTVAENVVDVVPRAGGDLPLVAKRRTGRLGDVVLPFVPERAFPWGDHVAVVGWDDLGRAAYVVDLAPATPTLSARFDLGGAWYAVCDPAWGMARADGAGLAYGGSPTDAVLTDDGHLVVHGLVGTGAGTPPPGGGIGGGGIGGGGMGGGGVMPMGGAIPTPGGGGGGGGPTGPLDGFVVINVASATLAAPIEVADGFVTGFVADDGGDLVFTVGGDASSDRMGRPRMRHDLVRVDLATRASTTAVNVPGYVVSAAGDLVFTVEETWDDGWTWDRAVVGSSIAAGVGADVVVTVLDRRALPADAYDVRATGATLVWTTMGAMPGPVPMPPVADGDVAWGVPGGMGWMPTTTIGSMRLGATVAAGPSFPTTDAFVAVVLVEEGAVLVVEDGVRLVRFDLTGPTATATFTAPLVGWPLATHPRTVSGTYVVALGYAGSATAP